MAKARTGTTAHVSAELRDAITSLHKAGKRKSALTLRDVRLALQRNSSTWSQEGELLHPQDRTALLMEIDELIERYGGQYPAPDLLPGKPS